MLSFDRKRFFDGFRKHLDPTIEQGQADGLEFLLSRFEADRRWAFIPHIAYALATIYHETAFTFQPITERGPKSYFLRYDIEKNPEKAEDLGNTHPGDGYKFRGRGYVQLTGRKNYARYGIATEPDQALNPDKAFEVMTDGMFRGRYTGKKLTDYISDTGKDYFHARKVINGLDKAGVIAGYAREFEEILRASKTTSAAGSIEPPTVNESSNLASESATAIPANSEPAAPAPEPEVKTTEVAQVGPTTTAVETTVPAGDPPEAPPTQVSQNGPLAKWLAGGGGLTAIGTFVWGYIQSNPSAVAIAVICVTLLIIVIIFRGAITDAIRMQVAADPNKKNVT